MEKMKRDKDLENTKSKNYTSLKNKGLAGIVKVTPARRPALAAARPGDGGIAAVGQRKTWGGIAAGRNGRKCKK
jgi:hypothetical protein